MTQQKYLLVGLGFLLIGFSLLVPGATQIGNDMASSFIGMSGHMDDGHSGHMDGMHSDEEHMNMMNSNMVNHDECLNEDHTLNECEDEYSENHNEYCPIEH